MSEENNDGRFNLSRRKALAGIGSIGAATALGGIGTYAQFTDTEGDSVTFTAGGIDGVVEYGASYNGNDIQTFDDRGPNYDLENVEKDGDGVGLNFNLTDVKPGDYGCFSFSIVVENNPAWAAACIGYEDDTDNQVWEEEVREDDNLVFNGSTVEAKNGNTIGEWDPTTAGPIGTAGTEGELADNLLFIPFYGGDTVPPNNDTFDPCVFFDDEEMEFDEEAIENYNASGAVSTPSEFWDNATGDLTPAPLTSVSEQTYTDSERWGANGTDPNYVDYPDAPEMDEGCIFLNGDGDNDNTQNASTLTPGSKFRFGWDWHLPYDTGNEVQGDSMTLNLGFSFSQARHAQSAKLSNVFLAGNNTPN